MHDIKKLGARFRIVIISDIDFYASSDMACILHIQRKNTKKLIEICQYLLLLGTIDTFAGKSDPTWSYTLADTKANKGFDNRSNHHAFMMRMTRHRKLSLFRWYFWFEYFSIIFKITCGMVFVFSNWQITWRCSFKSHIAVNLPFLSISCFEFDVHTVALYFMFIQLTFNFFCWIFLVCRVLLASFPRQ